jgi:hypothetical protein
VDYGGGVLLVLGVVVLEPPTANAHPSDFRTLTIDLIFESEGLVTIDAAVVESFGPGYEPFPSVDLRQQVAEDVTAALGLEGAAASINPELSKRYHEAGFFVVFDQPQPGNGESLRVDTAPFQAIAASANLDVLKLSVCSEIFETFDELSIDASDPGRAATDSRAERPWCEIWELGVDDPPVTISIGPFALPMTGFSLIQWWIAALAILTSGLILVEASRDKSLEA